MQSSDFNRLVSKFQLNAANSSGLLHEVLQLISDGKAPSEETVNHLDVSLEQLRDDYNNICKTALTLLQPDEYPGDGCSIGDFVDAIELSERQRYQHIISEAQKVLESFISVRSLVSAYAIALAPYQEKALSLMSQLSSATKIDIDFITQETAGPSAFLKALAIKEYDTDEELSVLEEAQSYYCSRVQTGLAGHKYFIGTEDIELQPQQQGKETIEPHRLQTEPNIIGTSSDNKDEVDSVPLQVEKEPDPNTDLPEENVHDNTDDNSAATDDGESVYQSYIVKFPVLGQLICEVSPAEEKKITSSVFLSDMRKGVERTEQTILKAINSRNLVNTYYLSTVKGIPQTSAESVLDFLFRKGYLKKYTLGKLDPIYCSSAKLDRAFGFAEVCKYIGVRQRKGNQTETPIEDKATSAAVRTALLRVYSDICSRYCADSSVKVYCETITTFTEAYILYVHDRNDTTNCEFSIGALWTEQSEIPEFFKKASSMMDSCAAIKRCIVTAYDFSVARHIADTIMEQNNEALSSTSIELFSITENNYMPYSGSSINSIENTDTPIAAEDATIESVHSDAINSVVLEPDETVTPSESVNDNSGCNRNISDISDTHNSTPMVETDIPSLSISEDEDNSTSDRACQSNKEDANSALFSTIYNLLNDGKYYAALAYAKACAQHDNSIHSLYNRLAFALNDPMSHCAYSTDHAFAVIDNEGSLFSDALNTSVALRTFFSNQVRYDYNIKAFYDGIKDCSLIHRFPSVSKVLYSIMAFKDTYKVGLDAYAAYRAKDHIKLEQAIGLTRRDAKSFYENYVLGKKKENASQERFIKTKKLMFSADSDIGQYMKFVVDDDRDCAEMLDDYLRNHFFKEESMLSDEAIDGNMLWDYIVVFWEKAGDNMSLKLHVPLMSKLRSNIISTTTKAVQILARWCMLVRNSQIQGDDPTFLEAKRVTNPVLECIESAISELRNYLSAPAILSSTRAGIGILLHTLFEIKGCLNGSFDEKSRKYIYAPFLLTDDVTLTEDFIPDFDVHSSNIEWIQPEYRILAHVQNMTTATNDYRVRLSDILENQGDDYGSAKLIVEYLSDVEDSSLISEQWGPMINDGEGYAKETANLRKEDFIGDLELAQSYGQIDNSEEDLKEKILQIIDSWYEWAIDTSNYGFFKKVMDCYLQAIRNSAKAREIDLFTQLENFRSASISTLSEDEKKKKVQDIEKLIREQKFTVAEDLLARAAIHEDDTGEISGVDYLRDFLDNYDDYYRPVAANNASVANLVSNKTRNKEQRGAKRLADNWLPGGSSLGRTRLINLLSILGFIIDDKSVKDQKPISRYEHYTVYPNSVPKVTHHIAPFGSGAVNDGFRVVCLNGVYSADNLIDVMKLIGNTKHTLILLDCALTKGERRRLARKTKNSLEDKLFVVVDRTVIMYLIKNYDENHINRMLIEITAPFGYYQPYVWESANVMPPEIFIGRKTELERIKSATGVNIVYGGRQLGKSALLKKAREEIDNNENGDRAVYVDIKELKYTEAARKIGHELYDHGVLEEDINTEDWDALARAIKKRLSISGEKRIPYLLLLIDEADAFIDSCETIKYKPFDALKDIQGIGTGRFKFVIAGLRNVVRFKREAALSKNSVLTHLESMTVKPFNTSDARELLEVPLHSLGLRFAQGKESLVTLILASTNYFPGLIQMYCAKLLESMRNKDYAGYDEVSSPIYEVSEEHIKRALANPEFMKQIREKYEITLKLDEDNYYYIIAMLMAYLYHENGYSNGYSADDILSTGNQLGITKISSLHVAKLKALMEELEELNVLRNTDPSHYLFTRFTFFQMMGTRSEVEDKLMDYMEA